MLAWLELTKALVVNRPSAMTSNGSKPLQSELIAEAGFAVPEILLTTDAAAAVEFRDRHRKVIYKSIGGVRSRVSLLEDKMIGRIGAAACATQLQEYISGNDIRAHVLGEEVFACTVESEAVDYRYPTAEQADPKIEACELPQEIAARCVRLTKMLGLSFAGVDLRHAADGRWVCFEANPSPGYTFYEQRTGAPITEALSSLLRRG
jgi:glutathione synthase/RimK-type ligase-like ATP-grasp enzyme